MEKVNAMGELDASIQEATSGHSVVGLSEMLGVSPSSMTQVQRAAKSGTLCSEITSNASTPPNLHFCGPCKYLQLHFYLLKYV